MKRRNARKRPYTPDQSGRKTLHQNVESDVDEIIDVETIHTAQLVNIRTTSPCENRGQIAVRKPFSRMSRMTSRLSGSLPHVRYTPKITLVGRGREERSKFTSLSGSQKTADNQRSSFAEVPPVTQRRAPILADEGIGTFAVPKLPLEEMTMSTKALRAIQEDHSLLKLGSHIYVDSQTHSISKDMEFSTGPSTSSDEQRKTVGSKAWKMAHEKMFAATMIEETDREENGEFTRIRYHCEYCDGWQHQLLKKECEKEGSLVVVYGCFAHLGHKKKVSAPTVRTLDPTFQRSRWKTIPAQCKYCHKWYGSQVMMNRHIKEQHLDSNFSKGTTIECGDPHCDVVCDRMSTLCEHVAQEHCRDDLVIEEFKFPCVNKFKHWKDQVEADTISKFVLSSSRTRASGIIQSYYLCHLSGYANRSRHSTLSAGRLRTTKKLGRYCTAFINTKELLDGAVTVQCCLGHFGHGFDVRRLPLPIKVKEEVSELLLKGTDPQAVQDIVRKKYSPGERGYYLKRYEIRNIADKLRRRGLILPKEKQSASTIVSLLHTTQLQTKPTFSAADNESNSFVTFQSIRMLPEQRARFPLYHAKIKESDNSKSLASAVHDTLFTNTSRSNSAALHTTIEGLRDVSPPIIGTSDYIEYDEESDYKNLNMTMDDERESLVYFLDETGNPETMLGTHLEKDAITTSLQSSKTMPLLMEHQPTGNINFDETMASLRKRINALYDQLKRTKDADKQNSIAAQIRSLQGQFVRGVPQTTAFFNEQHFDGEQNMDGLIYEPVDRDDTVCLEVEVESSETPYEVLQISEEHSNDITSFEGESCEDTILANYEQPSELYS
ncbi:zinc finger, C2H2 type [Dictyocaulus viviparus]|uniref:Zinc finger, C2H2 type n=1 Tax=Dictyocaulus viviparus TaxID=29172 RepID=A0A0D8XU92_DICVI|nr:zinc finger, C2H2 type [Dictyocaulus viviparus]